MLYHTLTDCWVEGNLFSFLPLALIWRYMNPQAGTASSPLFWGCCWCWATLKRYIFFVSLLSACFSNCNITSSGGGFSGGCYTSLHTSHQSKRTTHNYSPMNMHLLISRLLVGTIFFSTVCRMRVINLWLLFFWIHFFLSLLDQNLLNQSTVTSTLVASSRIHHCRTLLVVYRRGGVVVAPLECTPLLSVLQINTTDLTTLGRYGGSLEHKHSTLSLEKRKISSKYPLLSSTFRFDVSRSHPPRRRHNASSLNSQLMGESFGAVQSGPGGR